MSKRPKNSVPEALQQVNPEIGNMLRQVEMLKSLSEAAPTDKTGRSALVYLNAICANLATIVAHINNVELSETHPFYEAFQAALRRADNAVDGANILRRDKNIVVDGVFDMNELMKWIICSAPPPDQEG